MAPKITAKQQIVIDYITDRIMTGGLNCGDKLDTETNIAQSLNVTRATVREATRNLVEQDIVYRVRGSGLYVGMRKPFNSDSFHELSPFDWQAKQLNVPGIRKVVSAGVTLVPSADIASKLKIKPTDQVYRVDRLMCFGETPVSLEKIHIPINISNNFQFNELEKSKYKYIEHLTGKQVSIREQDLKAFNLDDQNVSELMNVPLGKAMIQLSEVVYFKGGQPFEYTVTIINSDHFNTHQVIRRN
ncbi:GntR family transcriptional regulator [Vibrio sp. TRT 17S01]|uniref:GntR family transcriptional regulator n=1 Tax=Vibrio sp. TRT 17S01 TaxID=3418505 RepID=UPI003CF805BF